MITRIGSALKEHTPSAKMYFVGGGVRDSVIGIQPKDIDLLVTGIPLPELASILEPFGKINEVGKSFGIVKATFGGSEYDFSIPRTETSTGHGHREQITNTDHTLPVSADLSRRDFTMNAIAMDVETGEYIDPFGGVRDIHMGVICAVGNPFARFKEDPLRMLRAVQFACRFDFQIDPVTKKAIIEKVDLLEHLSKERFLDEFKKAIEKSKDQTNHRLLTLLEETGIGKFLFGPDFNPIKYSSSVYLPNLVALFINGGNFSALNLPLNDQAVIKMARQLNAKEQNPWLWVKNSKNLLFPTLEFLKVTKSSVTEYAEKILDYPMTLKELDVTGEDLMTAGIQNVEIGKTTNKILEAVWTGDITNNKHSILRWLNS